MFSDPSTTEGTPCVGNHYDVSILETPSSDLVKGRGRSRATSSHSGHLDTYSYGPQSPAQTRILRLHPKGFSPEGEARDDGMYADLVTVNLHILEGVMIDGTTQNNHYDALSYS